MKRRDFILCSAVPLALLPWAALAQTAGGARRIAFLATWLENDEEGAKRLAALKLRLQELGWSEGKNVQLDVRFGNNNGERIRQAATEIAGLAPDVIISS